jgi:succinate-semialdehyde dehydrogenase / glutarate-semialdehyde dehydrogenase
MRAASDDLKRLSLELGGHTPFVVLGDADVEEAVSGALRRSFSNMGQICIAVNRILVASEVASDFAEALTEATRNLSIDHGIETDVEYGPVLNEAVASGPSSTPTPSSEEADSSSEVDRRRTRHYPGVPSSYPPSWHP